MIIAGGRKYTDYEGMERHMLDLFYILRKKYPTDSFHRDNIIEVCGMARGADTLGKRWAKENDITVARFPANWDKNGKTAGIKRNIKMGVFAAGEFAAVNDEKPLGILVAFWDGKSKGTAHMIEVAKKKNLDIFTLNYTKENPEWKNL